jgi:uroporphyrinogen-III synthase
MAPAPRVIVTRPAAQAALWVDALHAQGLAAHSFALIEIADALHGTQRTDLHARAAQVDVCMWVSSNAVACFFKPNKPPAQQSIARTAIDLIAFNTTARHWATGPGTVAALQAHGVPTALIDAPDMQAAQWDTQALWQRVSQQVQPGTRVLILRGIDIGTPSASRDWLAQQVRAAGGVAEFSAVYERRAPQFTPEQVAWAQQAAVDDSVWVFSSSQAVTHLPTVPGGWGQARCVATHERIAQAAHARGFAVVCTSRPDITEVVQSIKSMP